MASKAEGSHPRLKLIIRRLPPTLPEEVFWSSVSAWISVESCTWKRFIRGRPSAGAYCLMRDVDVLVAFHRGFDGHVFKSKTGPEFQAVVEYAPVQKAPSAVKARSDPRQGTIEHAYKPLSKRLLSSRQVRWSPDKLMPVPPVQPTSTPLLAYLRSQGVKSSKKKTKTVSSSTDIARNAAAAVNASAVRRKPKDQGTPIIAGKGRAVVLPGAAPPNTNSASGSGKRKKGNKGKGKDVEVPPPRNTPTNFPALASPASAEPPRQAARAPMEPGPTAPRRVTQEPDRKAGNRSRDTRDVAPTGGGNKPAAPNTQRAPQNAGRGRGRGRGVQSPRDTVIGILTKNTSKLTKDGDPVADDPRTARIAM